MPGRGIELQNSFLTMSSGVVHAVVDPVFFSCLCVPLAATRPRHGSPRAHPSPGPGGAEGKVEVRLLVPVGIICAPALTSTFLFASGATPAR
jgi:hypothetical protein